MFKSIFSNSFGILTSRITGLARDILMTSALGANVWSDVFFMAFKFPNLFRRIFAEGSFTQSFMPSYIASRQKSVFAVAIFIRFMLFIIALSLLVTLFPGFFTKILAWDWNADLIAKTAPLTIINFWYLDLIFIVTFLGTLLQHREHFFTTAFSTVWLNIAMIAALILFAHSDPKIIVYALSFSILAGGVFQVITHLYTMRQKGLMKLLIGGWKYRKTKDVKAEESKFSSLFFPSVLGNSTAQIASFIDTSLASFLAAGSVSYLFYANRIFQLPFAIIALAITTALFPAIAKAINNDNHTLAFQNLHKAFWLLSALLALSVLGGTLLSEPIIWLLFERGAFTIQDTHNTANVLMMYMVGLVPFGLAKLFSLYLYAMHKHIKAAKIAAASLIINIICSLILMKPLGAAGLALAGSIGGAVQMVLTIREVGWNIFFDLLKTRFSLYFVIGSALFAVTFYALNNFLIHLIR
ncbi:MAG: murein biosynthesis integral membrane protein MurJ [Sulfuricurvum sp.]|uniref:murein biosynthesis integral membrane protein MurJ n=1 Tax=Sulfuricurvum sp. TaxID=2025608 RepID=UPI002608E5E9|nr:murein biosynthesis integral membrane protein MurJ [Sulfuricurvum sp.]MDD2828984.1 murein biosynthesis integral membrane protein MurJ [Sulfuricurvum sp.]MDD4950083.1 murein biosynthesis integral membrane protein MurJ [Sulfuricurvum sp.]